MDAIGPPELPQEVPAEVRDFVECRTATLIVRDGPLAWVRLPRQATTFLSGSATPTLTIRAGSVAGSARVEVKVGFISVGLLASIRDGRLAIDTASLPGWLPASIRSEAAGFVDRLNGWFDANGQELAPLEVSPGEVALRKSPRAAFRE